MRIHHPIFGGFLVVVGLLVVLVVTLVSTGLRPQLLDLTQAEVTRQVRIASLLLSQEPSGADLDALADRISDRVGHRVSIIGTDGFLVGDSDVSAGGLRAAGSHADRPEILAAREGGTGVAERRSATVGVELLYVAEALDWNGEDLVIRISAPLDGIRGTLARSRRAVLFSGLIALVLSLVVAYLLSRALARPLVAVSQRAAQLAKGDFSQRVPQRTRVAELDDLATAFNRLTDELQARMGELARDKDEMQALIDCMAEGVIGVTEDARILRTNRAARELLEFAEPPVFTPVGTIIRHAQLRDVLERSVVEPMDARELSIGDRHLIASSRLLDEGGAVTTFLDITAIKRVEQVRRDFVANASHELKTPLTAMRGFAETLADNDPPEEIRKEFLNSIRVNTIRLQMLVDDLLDLSRLESGGWVTRPEEVDLAAIAQWVWDDLQAGDSSRDVAFSVRGEAIAWADPQGVQQVFQNLIDNARRYTPDGGSVAVHISTVSPAEISVAVMDTGAGIPSQSLPRIFERFYRADTSRAREVGGTGLGLAIVRHLVQQMDGNVSAVSELGRGTTITFKLPSAPPAGGH